MSKEGTRLKRRLYAWEIDEFKPVFGSSLDYGRVWIHECTSWPDLADRLGRRLKGMAPPGERDHNAVTLGNHCYFPVPLPTHPLPLGDRESYKLDWLIHELTHAWQYQKLGWEYLWLAIRAQLKERELAYDFGGESGLVKSHQKSIHFKKFNPEQQGNIVQSYYVRKRGNQDVSAWEPFIEELRT
jgi:hypothetical protein